MPPSKKTTKQVETYIFTIVFAKDKKSKAGNDMVVIKLQSNDDANFTIYDYIVFPPANSKAKGILRKSMQFLKCIGMPQKAPKPDECRNWVSKEVKVTLTQQEWQGEMQDKINSYVYDNKLNIIEDLPDYREDAIDTGNTPDLPF